MRSVTRERFNVIPLPVAIRFVRRVPSPTYYLAAKRYRLLEILQVNNSTRLKFSTNACRRARWYARLGFHHVDSGPISRISTLFPNGGFISHLSAMVARVYPLLFLEKNSDLSSGSFANIARIKLLVV